MSEWCINQTYLHCLAHDRFLENQSTQSTYLSILYSQTNCIQWMTKAALRCDTTHTHIWSIIISLISWVVGVFIVNISLLNASCWNSHGDWWAGWLNLAQTGMIILWLLLFKPQRRTMKTACHTQRYKKAYMHLAYLCIQMHSLAKRETVKNAAFQGVWVCMIMCGIVCVYVCD